MIMGTLLFASTLMLDCEKKKFKYFHRKKGKYMGDRKKGGKRKRKERNERNRM